MNKYLRFIAFALILLYTIPSKIHSQEILQDKFELVRAEVTQVMNQERKTIPGTDVQSDYQTIVALILEGRKTGQEVVIENDYLSLERGDKFFLHINIDAVDGHETYSVRDVDRRGAIAIFVLIFVTVILIFSGKQGIFSLASLVGSLLVIIYVLIPLLLKGYSPIIVSMSVASLILFFAIYITHGFNRHSTVAFIGTVAAIIVTGILAYIGVEIAHLTGFVSDEAVTLNFSTRGSLNFSGLLLGGIMIGILGVLDDISVTQAAVVSEIFESAPHLTRREVYKKALRVGREHVGALVNTLALAYAGSALPLMLLFSTSNTSLTSIINLEVFATEIIRTAVGSIGLILTVPITTLLAVYVLKGHKHTGGAHCHHCH